MPANQTGYVDTGAMDDERKRAQQAILDNWTPSAPTGVTMPDVGAQTSDRFGANAGSTGDGLSATPAGVTAPTGVTGMPDLGAQATDRFGANAGSTGTGLSTAPTGGNTPTGVTMPGVGAQTSDRFGANAGSTGTGLSTTPTGMTAPTGVTMPGVGAQTSDRFGANAGSTTQPTTIDDGGVFRTTKAVHSTGDVYPTAETPEGVTNTTPNTPTGITLPNVGAQTSDRFGANAGSTGTGLGTTPTGVTAPTGVTMPNVGAQASDAFGANTGSTGAGLSTAPTGGNVPTTTGAGTPGTGTPGTSPTGTTPAPANTIDQELQDLIASLSGETTLDSNGVKGAYDAYRVASERARARDQNALAEQYGAQGNGARLGGLQDAVAQLNERTGENQSSYAGNLVKDQMNQRRQSLLQALQIASANGNTKAAQAIQMELAKMQLGYQYTALDKNTTLAQQAQDLQEKLGMMGLKFDYDQLYQNGNLTQQAQQLQAYLAKLGLGFDYTKLQSDANQNALLAGLNG